MAPSVSEIAPTPKPHAASEAIERVKAKLNTGAGPSYPAYLPHYDTSEKFPPTELFVFRPRPPRGPRQTQPPHPNTTLRHLSPYLGTEVHGIQLSSISSAAKDELALLVAERKVVIFRDQDFKDLGSEKQIEFAQHFGPIHRHPTSGNVKGFPEFHVVYRDPEYDYFKEYITDDRVGRTSWHSDVAYELQPPGTTFFFILDQPSVGGDTLFASQVEAYNRLSPEFQKRLEGLKIVHSAVNQAEASRNRGGPVRREPIETEHPVVRVHPVTGEKALYVNPVFGRRIVGFKKEESDWLLQFLYDHIAKGADFHIRATYEPGTVVVWDNRVTVHSATPDFSPEFRRHAVRLTPSAEVPIPAGSP